MPNLTFQFSFCEFVLTLIIWHTTDTNLAPLFPLFLESFKTESRSVWNPSS